MKSITKLSVILLAAASLTAASARAQSDASPATTNSAPAAAPRARRAPRFQGTITAIDAATMTLTLKGRVETQPTKVKVTSTTKIFKDKDPGTFADATVGLRVSGAGKKGDDGVWEATTLRIVTTPAPTPPPPAAASPSAPK